jgi:hypothetical protein
MERWSGDEGRPESIDLVPQFIEREREAGSVGRHEELLKRVVGKDGVELSIFGPPPVGQPRRERCEKE